MHKYYRYGQPAAYWHANASSYSKNMFVKLYAYEDIIYVYILIYTGNILIFFCFKFFIIIRGKLNVVKCSQCVVKSKKDEK